MARSHPLVFQVSSQYVGTGGDGISSSLNIAILDPLYWAGIFERAGTGGGLSSSLKTVIFDETGPDATHLDFPARLRVVPPAVFVSGTFSFTRTDVWVWCLSVLKVSL